MLFKIIVAIDDKNGIGRNNTLPWSIPEDLKHFAKKTKGKGKNAIIMGRNTYQSIGQVLSGRVNYVLSKTLKESDENTPETTNDKKNYLHVYDNFKNLLSELFKKSYDEVWVIGGSQIYTLFLQAELVSELHITRVPGDHNCDAFFPDIKDNADIIEFYNKFKKIDETPIQRKNGESVTYLVYKKMR